MTHTRAKSTPAQALDPAAGNATSQRELRRAGDKGRPIDAR